MTVIIINDNDMIIAELRRIGMYDTFQEQMKRVRHLSKQQVVLCDKSIPDKNKADYYTYHFGQDDPAENGWTLIRITDPQGHPEIVTTVEKTITGQFQDTARTLWVDDPLTRN